MLPLSCTDRIPHLKIQEFPNGDIHDDTSIPMRFFWTTLDLHFSIAQPPSLANS